MGLWPGTGVQVLKPALNSLSLPPTQEVSLSELGCLELGEVWCRQLFASCLLLSFPFVIPKAGTMFFYLISISLAMAVHCVNRCLIWCVCEEKLPEALNSAAIFLCFFFRVFQIHMWTSHSLPFILSVLVSFFFASTVITSSASIMLNICYKLFQQMPCYKGCLSWADFESGQIW